MEPKALSWTGGVKARMISERMLLCFSHEECWVIPSLGEGARGRRAPSGRPLARPIWLAGLMPHKPVEVDDCFHSSESVSCLSWHPLWQGLGSRPGLWGKTRQSGHSRWAHIQEQHDGKCSVLGHMDVGVRLAFPPWASGREGV